MKKIKKYLKEVEITQKQLAKKLGLSRPTLDAYIDMYEQGETIPKEKYAIAFDRLFSKKLPKEEFYDSIESLSYLLKRDFRYGTSDLSPEASDMVSSIMQSMKKDMSNNEWDEDAYIFLNSFIQNYRSNEVFYYLSKYFVYLNTSRDLNEITDEQIPYMANFYKTFRNMLAHGNVYDESDYQAYIERCLQLRSERNSNRNSKRKKIEEIIDSKLLEYENKGIELSETELVDIVKKELLSEKGNNTSE